MPTFATLAVESQVPRAPRQMRPFSALLDIVLLLGLLWLGYRMYRETANKKGFVLTVLFWLAVIFTSVLVWTMIAAHR